MFANVNPEILSWARDRAQMSTAMLSGRNGLPKEERLIAWETGELRPTFKQAKSFAKAVHVPFGYLFLSTPPKEKLPIPDLRTIGSEHLEKPSAELLEIIQQVMFRQAWYQEYMMGHHIDNCPVVGRATIDTATQAIVDDMRKVLGVPKIPARGSWEDNTRQLIACIEEQGVLVMRSGIIGNNTHRPLSVNEFRGFAISDKAAPIIFINAADAPQARLFTLIHELAHIWLGISGVSDGKHNTHRKEERVCNEVAAEFLVPTDVFLPKWNPELEDWRDNLAAIASSFHVSPWVIARKALDNDLISSEQYGLFSKEILEGYKNKDSSGGNFYRNLKAKLSERFSIAVITETTSGRTLYRDAGRLLGVQPAKIGNYAKELGI